MCRSLKIFARNGVLGLLRVVFESAIAGRRERGSRARDEGLKNAFIDRLAGRLVARAAECRRVLQA
jgi:hypothetical protein